MTDPAGRIVDLYDEQAEGWFLPCVAMARSDLVVEQPMAWPAPAP